MIFQTPESDSQLYLLQLFMQTRSGTYHSSCFEREPIAGSRWQEAHRPAFPQTNAEGQQIAEDIHYLLKR